MRTVSFRQLVICLGTGVVLTGTGGCASLVRNTVRSHSIAPNGLPQADYQFRRALIAGDYAKAYERSGKVKSGAPQDQLLRALYRGTTAFHAGDFAVAAQSFGEADRIAEERETRSLSRQAASLVTNDQVLSYLPSRTERLFTRYYAMMSYLRANDQQAATVEARRLGVMLQATSDSIGASERAVHATLREAAGAVFEAAGETNDALVSYRNAALLRGASPQEIDSIAIAPRSADSATVIVFVESGFVAHRVNQEISVPFGTRTQRVKSHADTAQVQTVNATQVVSHRAGSSFNGSSSLPLSGHFQPAVTTKERESSRESRRDSSTDDSPDVPAVVAAILASVDGSDDGVFAGDERNWRRHRRFEGNRWERMEDAVEAGTLFLTFAWPALVRSSLPEGATGSNVSDAVAADLRRALPSMLARLVVRSAAKAKITDAVGDEYGRFARVLTGIAGSVLERADTRSWQLLPGNVTVVRTRVAASDSSVSVTVGGETNALSVPVERRALAPGAMFVTSARVFHGETVRAFSQHH